MNETNLDSPDEISWDQIQENVRVYVDALKSSGFKKADVMSVIGGSSIRSLCLVLAAAAVGGIVASFATDAGERVLSERIGQIRPKILFAEPHYRYNGKRHDIKDRIQGVWDSINPSRDSEIISTMSDTPKGWTSFEKFCKRGAGRPLEFEQVPFHTPFVVMFSSGTTGTPKGIVHSQGGLIVNGMKEHKLHYNHDEKAVHYHYAGIGWTLWNIMIGALLVGTPIVLYDGSPFYPNPQKLLTSVLATGVTSFGAGPRYFTELQKDGISARPYTSKVDKIPSAGALLTEQMSLWIRDSFGPHICQISTSGGTELCGNFVHGTQTLPVYAGENAVKDLGMDVDIFGPDGKPVPEGEAGELVCKKPFPNMPAMFWNDPDKKKYRAAYFEGVNPHVWTHGDYIRINPETKGLIILGRSDGVLNPSGIRFGSGEIYTVLERCAKDEIVDSICVGQQREQDQSERVFLFLQLKNSSGKGIGEELEKRIKGAITKDLSRRHVPHFFFAVDQIPYNVNGKKLEIPLRAVLSEGEKAFSRRKFTADERKALEYYLPYFEVERITSRLKPKL
ncbi:Acetoacetyl-CoA synthetase [Pseudocercospora fuligena]|uniref:Acetoacetyl-CoA synthetase n=1 Tax=Pseudocercospora fuligena TaxID=685502 RepID=A0A8H6RDI0_9PEZI|nr:Acetoacetyl-CoA synthetase [Pseudocercospora fuligena]